jgi:hypothetical protein
MKKNSYKSAPNIKDVEPLKGSDLPSVPAAEEGLSSETGAGIGRGWIIGEPVMPPVYTEQEEAPYYLRDKGRANKVSPSDLNDMLIEIADIKDESGKVVEANFIDFLIKKIAEQKDFDNRVLFKDLIMRIVESDLVFYNDIIKEITKHYNRLLVLHVESGVAIEEARQMAFGKAEVKAQRYVK